MVNIGFILKLTMFMLNVGFDFNKMTSLSHEYMKERHKAFYERLRKKLFLKLTDKAAYDADYTQRLADLLRRGKA